MTARQSKPSNASLLSSALRYAVDLGWPVFPCHGWRDGACSCQKSSKCTSAGKHPRTRNGHKAATTDEKIIEDWWEKWPTANIGLLTGADTDLVVLDFDLDHCGEDSLRAAEKRLGSLPDCPWSLTGGGGRHLLFQHPGERLACRQNILPGFDVRADGGYIIAPPSIHRSGRTYRWQIDPEDIAPPTLPQIAAPVIPDTP